MADDDWAPAAASALAEVTDTGPRPRPEVEVPGYTDLREVARGGDSIVYRARQTSVDRDVAIKVIQSTDPADAARFDRELAITVRLGRQHPHIVTVLDTTTAATGEPCLVMEFHDLGSLHDRLREHGPLPTSDVVAAGTAVADALAFAHAHGVLHRDVKPQNILVLPTSYVLSDFGIARMADAGHTATLERFSYRHASPQVLDGMPPTEADDVWSLGSTLFTLLDGRAPFASLDPVEDTALSYLRRVRIDQRRPLERDDIPDDLRALIDAALVPDRDQRLGTAAEALRRLRRIRTEDRSWNPAAPQVVDGDDATRPRPEHSVESVPAAPDNAPSAPVSPEPDQESADDAWAPAAQGRRSRPRSTAAEPVAQPSGTQPSVAPAPEPEESDEASPVAPSVLAHVESRRSRARAKVEPEAPDEGHTGVAPSSDGDGDGGDGDGDRGGGGSVAPWRRIAAFLGGALLVGAAIGVGSSLLNGGGDEEATPTVTQPVTAVPSTSLPTDPETVNIEVVDPAVSPRQLAIDEDRGTAVVLSWTPAEQPVQQYFVVRTDVDPDLVVAPVQPPLTTATVEGLAPDGSECFRILGLPVDTTADRGYSEEVCRAG